MVLVVTHYRLLFNYEKNMQINILLKDIMQTNALVDCKVDCKIKFQSDARECCSFSVRNVKNA